MCVCARALCVESQWQSIFYDDDDVVVDNNELRIIYMFS